MNESILPPDFDGVFRFTNFSDEDFTGKWGGIEYTYPALKTSPMFISGATPEEVQTIRKKFAKELATREYAKSSKYKSLLAGEKSGSVTHGAFITDSDLAPMIQKCLEPLPLAQAAIRRVKKDEDSKFRVDKKGKRVTRILDENESLLGGGSAAIE